MSETTPAGATNGAARIAILGGTGALGGGLAFRWARAGREVLIGSRTEEKGKASADELLEKFPEARISGTDNRSAAAAADVVVLTVPYAHHASTLESVRDVLQGKILIDCTVPLKPPKVARVQLPEAGSAAVEAQQLLGGDVRVVSAFQNVGAEHLRDDHPIECDVLVTGDDPEAREVAIGLVEDAGLVGLHAGPLPNAAAAEALTSVLIFINKKYEIRGSGLRITKPAE